MNCLDCLPLEIGVPGYRRVKRGATADYHDVPECGAAPDGTLSSCTSFYFTGLKWAMDCGVASACFAQIRLTESASQTYWLKINQCGDATNMVQQDDADCAGKHNRKIKLVGFRAHRAHPSSPHPLR